MHINTCDHESLARRWLSPHGGNRSLVVLCLSDHIMGKFADDVILRLKNELAQNCLSYSWNTEYRIAETPVDVVGISDEQHILTELEWRRADPADNVAKIFRHLSTREIIPGQVIIVQLFTNYYSLVSGGVSSKRKNAEFVGEIAADSLDHLTYLPLDFEIDPPKSGETRSPEWKDITDSIAAKISSEIGCS